MSYTSKIGYLVSQGEPLFWDLCLFDFYWYHDNTRGITSGDI
jgi:hypothetical protein